MTTIDIFEKVAKGEITPQQGADLLMKRERGEYFKFSDGDVAVGTWLHLERMDKNQWWLRLWDSAIWVKFRWPRLPSIAFEKGAYGYTKGELEEEAKQMFSEEFKRIRKIAKLSEKYEGVTKH